jgi:hypothetical protein
MGRCREGKSEVPFAVASHKCGKCGARTAKPTNVCQPEPIERDALRREDNLPHHEN